MNDVKLLAQLLKNGTIKVPSEVTLEDVKYFYDNFNGSIVLPVARIDTPNGSYTPEEVKNEIRFDNLMCFAFDEIVTDISTAFIIAPGLWTSDNYAYGLFTQNGTAIDTNYKVGVPAYDENYDYTVFPIKISREASIRDIINSGSAGVVLRIYQSNEAE